MSQAESHGDSSAGSDAPSSRPPPSPPLAIPPPALPPAPPRAPLPVPPQSPARPVSAPNAAKTPDKTSKPPEAAPPAKRVASKFGFGDQATVPPPPPARSAPADVRPAPAIHPKVSGVGSARVRWRGELESINRNFEARERAEKRIAAGLEPEPEDAPVGEPELRDDVVTRSAPPWLVSMVIHLIVLLILAFITKPASRGITRVLLDLGFSENEPEAAVTLETFSLDSDLSVDPSQDPADEVVDMDVPAIFETVDPVDASEVAPVELGISSLKIAKPMFNARTGAMKKAMMAMFGATKETQDAVELGLAWLKRNQQVNGSWSMKGPFSDGGITENRCAATAMALLAFVGNGNTHKSGPYAAEVDRGLKFLISIQNRRTGFMAKDARDHERMYAQAQATIVLCELYAMTRDSWLRPRAQLAVDFAEDAQSDLGGWRYRPRIDSDTSVTGWFVMALQSALAAGLEVNESKLYFVNDYLDTVSEFRGDMKIFNQAGYAYQPGQDPSPAMTAEGLLCREYLGWPRDHERLKFGITSMLIDAMFDTSDPDVYYWYYATQVLHHYGGDPWKQWNDVMKVQLPRSQVKTGREAGSWAPQRDPWGRNSGRLYTTCFSIFCLEVYYRHMPLYRHRMK